MKALSVICTLAVLFSLAPLGAQVEALGPSASGPLMQVSVSDSLQPASSADPGTIAYVKFSTHDIHLISPDGANDRVLWSAPRPLSSYVPLELAWRPDGRELAFSSDHEETCSWYTSDVYAVSFSGGGYRRVTNAPACDLLAGLPKGSVTVNVSNWTITPIWVYVAGAPGIKYISGDGTVTFDDVADFGPGVPQPAIGIWGLYRIMSSPPLADVKPNETVPGGNIVVSQYSGIKGFGAGKISWKADGSALAYAMRTYSGIDQIPTSPPYGSIGQALPVVEGASPGLVAWGPTHATKDQYLYYSSMDVLKDNVGGIYLNSVGDTSGGTQLVLVPDYSGQHISDVEWLPDGSGFLFTLFHVELGFYSDIFEYNIATQSITQLTPSLNDESSDGGARGLSISPDGQHIVFERAIYPFDTSNSLWMMDRDGSDLHKLADDAGRPAWGRTPSFPVPTITSLNPSSVIAGSSALTLRVDGTDFVSGSVVRWNGRDRTTMYVNDTQLTASIPAADIATAGSASVTVFNPAPGGGTSNTAAFGVLKQLHMYLPAILR